MQQQQQQRFSSSWPPDTWYEDALGCREIKGSSKSGAYLKNQQVLWNMQQKASALGFPPHSFAIGNSNSSAADTADAAVSLEQYVQYGEFSCPSVQHLREECRLLTQQLFDQDEQQQQQQQKERIIVWHTLPHTNVLHLYANNETDNSCNCNDDSTFQAASQFNCLEMTSPSITPESGITQYVHDKTQGPASAMACAAGTAFRNYLVHVDNVMNYNNNNNNSNNSITNLGQTKNHQINTLADILTQLEQRVPLDDNNLARRPLIRVRNGYAEATEASLRATHAILNNIDEEDEWIRLGRVGIQHETQATFPSTTSSGQQQRRRLVTQVYCSAIPIAYSLASTKAWEPLAKIVLKSCYEATLLVAVRNVARAMLEQRNRRQTTGTCTANNPPISNNNNNNDDDDEYNANKIYRLGRVYLTKVGGGVFGNDEEWILNAMRHAHERVTTFNIPLNVFIVNYGENSRQDELLVQQLNTQQQRPQQHQQQQQQQRKQASKNNENNNNNNHCTVH